MCSNPGCAGPVLPAHRKQLELIIRRHGWACQGVLDDGPGYPGWSYTIGLADQRRPEMIVIGLAHDTARAIFAQVIEEARSGLRKWPRSGDQIDGLLCGSHSMRVVRVKPDLIRGGDWFNLAKQRRAGRFSALQLVWPDRVNLFPDDGSAEQPVLGEIWWT